MPTLSTLFLFLAIIATSYADDGGTRILSENYASADDFPFMVSIRFKGTHICGGSILDFRWVLTAAHCLSQMGQKSFQLFHVLAGTVDLTGVGGSLHSVAQIFIHKNYTKKDGRIVEGDISLLKLSFPFTYSKTIQPISTGKLSYSNSKVIMIGFGVEENDQQVMSPLLKFVEMVTIVSDKVCTEDANHICAVAPKQLGSCNGDSGGPLIDADTRKLVGISSLGTKMCGSGLADVFTRVDAYWDWINYIMIYK